MKRCETLAQSPALLAAYVADQPDAVSWAAFRDEARSAYRELVDALSRRQRGLCAFCEISLRDGDRHVEHWHPKSEATVAQNWTFDVGNLHASCENLSKAKWFPREAARSGDPHPRPNHSCGAAKKDRIVADIPIDDRPYRPTELPACPPVFHVNGDGSILPTTGTLLSWRRLGATIAFLNLDCPRLRNARAAVWSQLDADFEDLLSSGLSDEEALRDLSSSVIVLEESGGLPDFVTTLRGYFGLFAEDRLAEIPDWVAAL